MLKIRLTRIGAPKKPCYRIIVTEARSPRDATYTDLVGTYNPMTNPETVVINAEKALYWIGKGAQPTDTVARLLKKAGVVNSN
ncbi:MAG: 30S ribosomal protein S16 [Dehalococcoides mccartyi]|jgi:small subunit ribosomal protein S16|uniref:Small ribosomal subunit protein bS16 n=3 Tax=root TaxID=1 RepID=RS16_DEHM1|nr:MULTISPECIES: 30S ribosomal protein S16 [Dehalococcoides]Q3Z8Y8.1 RecName: Full=Small ribosomal subunit protein bS16; AltName: Full=30S ribosomal protein S16 [Dehalococcoides mccartyi 195]AAW40160.1 ribosomal protein S16 [Dehalococcoides mccartyi 195]AII59250.1 30S ribosomal protein S16 [Dehalococcoides mccartyi CG4]AQU02959.1 30S ribosomal protein S16 [Dehalococcoides mccartyi]AQU04276.1 30S ribosomal protein S16 [Dehalococcoides mccartyi]KSV18625.1 30S ribosomal protein S16 [Dehalococcoi